MNSPTDRQKQFPDQEIGGSCQFEGCSKYDFLPFRCSGCDKTYCQEHRSGLMHNCKVKVIVDATSLDCIICGKSIRYNKGDDVNQVWEKHYLHQCTKEQQQNIKTKTCSVKTCRTALGLSNSYTCRHCNLQVCLSHRRQEDHNCSAFRSSSSAGSRADFINKLSGNNHQIKKPVSKTSSNLVGKGKNNGSNTGKSDKKGSGSKAPARTGGTGKTTVAVLECPFCFRVDWSSAAQLQAHVESCMSVSAQSEGSYSNSSSSSNSNSSSSSSSGGTSANTGSVTRGHHIGIPIVLDQSPQRQTGSGTTGNMSVAVPVGGSGERCPQCNATFTDPVALVSHFEEVHGQDSKKKKCTIT